MVSSTDCIEKSIFLRAPQERVWRALTDPREFGAWFGVEFEGSFVAGRPVSGRIKPTIVDPAVAEMQKHHTGMRLTFVVERLEPMSVFAYRWHPFAIDPQVDYSHELMTLVTFTLEPASGGTMLRVVESGFDSIPIERRADAFEANDEGWTLQLQLVQKYLALPAA